MRALLLGVALVVLAGCGSSKTGSNQEEAGKTPDDAPPASGGQDYEAYVEKLKADVPMDVKDFQKAKRVAVEYEKNERYPNLFKSVTIDIPRVYLTDKTTGKGQWYSRARMTLNNPTPAKMNSRGMYTSIPEPFAWASVVLSK